MKQVGKLQVEHTERTRRLLDTRIQCAATAGFRCLTGRNC
jgi:hypothetical protein